MTHIELASPVPRTEPYPCRPFSYRTGPKQYLRIPDFPLSDPGFFATITSRRTRREFSEPPHDRFAEFLWYSAKVWSASIERNSNRWQHRTSPSSGGIHCVDLLILEHDQDSVMLYEPVAHAIQELSVDRQIVRRFMQEVEKAGDLDGARIIWFAADFELMLSRYENGESLVWRDVGALVSTMCFVAEALQFACCPIGMTGEPYISALFDSTDRISGAGGILVGARR